MSVCGCVFQGVMSIRVHCVWQGYKGLARVVASAEGVGEAKGQRLEGDWFYYLPFYMI